MKEAALFEKSAQKLLDAGSGALAAPQPMTQHQKFLVPLFLKSGRLLSARAR
jgi:hypothetical protein